MQRVWVKFSQGSTIDAVNSSDIKSLIIHLPMTKEQQKIANFLTTFDEKINAIQTQLTNTKNFKKGLLQKMFV